MDWLANLNYVYIRSGLEVSIVPDHNGMTEVRFPDMVQCLNRKQVLALVATLIYSQQLIPREISEELESLGVL